MKAAGSTPAQPQSYHEKNHPCLIAPACRHSDRPGRIRLRRPPSPPRRFLSAGCARVSPAGLGRSVVRATLPDTVRSSSVPALPSACAPVLGRPPGLRAASAGRLPAATAGLVTGGSSAPCSMHDHSVAARWPGHPASDEHDRAPRLNSAWISWRHGFFRTARLSRCVRVVSWPSPS